MSALRNYLAGRFPWNGVRIMPLRQIELMIVGAQKAGTSSLLKYLGQHPDICTHPQRECVFFFSDTEHAKGYEYSFNKYFSQAKPDQILVAKHALLMYSETAMERLFAHNFNALIVAVLRNPIDRAYSAYWFARSRGWEEIPTFEEAIRVEADRLRNGGWMKWPNNAYLYNGQYVSHIKKLYKYFGTEKTQIYLVEDLKSGSQKLVGQLYKMVGINDAFLPDVTRKHNAATTARSEKFAQWLAAFLDPQNRIKRALRRTVSPRLANRITEYVKRANLKEFVPPTLSAETRKYLAEYFRPANEQLSDLLGRDLSSWK